MKEEKEEEVCREVSFNSMNYAVTVKSNHKKDTLEKLKQIGLEILKNIQEGK